MLDSIRSVSSKFDHVIMGDLNAPSIDWADEVAVLIHEIASSLLDMAHDLSLH